MSEKTEGKCFVHNKKTLSQFHSLINQVYRTKQFDKGIIQKIPKLCCNCQQTNRKNRTQNIFYFEFIFVIFKEESSIDFDYLIKLCQQLEQLQLQQNGSIVKKPKQFYHLSLPISGLFTSKQRLYKVGQFIGQHGKNIRKIEKNLNISLKIINSKSSKHDRTVLHKLPDYKPEGILSELAILIELKDENVSIETIKQAIQNEWDNIDVSLRSKSTSSIKGTKNNSQPLPEFETDSRWQPLSEFETDSRWQPKHSKQKAKSKAKRNQQQQSPAAIADQPSRPFFKQ